ncbi:MAG: ABATE domain-containing protein [Actinomycetota bacterium]
MDRPALALVMTGGQTPIRAYFEILHSPADLSAWLSARPGAPGGLTAGPQDLAAAVGLREALFTTIRLRTLGQPHRPGDLQVINAVGARAPLTPAIDPVTGQLAWSPASVPAALSTIARDGIELLTGDLAGRVRECANPRCELVFLDTSPPGARRWCAMGRCGNRAKNEQYRRRGRLGLPSVHGSPVEQLPEHGTVPS